LGAPFSLCATLFSSSSPRYRTCILFTPLSYNPYTKRAVIIHPSPLWGFRKITLVRLLSALFFSRRSPSSSSFFSFLAKALAFPFAAFQFPPYLSPLLGCFWSSSVTLFLTPSFFSRSEFLFHPLSSSPDFKTPRCTFPCSFPVNHAIESPVQIFFLQVLVRHELPPCSFPLK